MHPESGNLMQVHTTPEHVVQRPEYVEFMRRFGLSTQHFIVSMERCAQTSVFRSAHVNHLKLHQLHPTLFPRYQTSQIPFKTCPDMFAGASRDDYYFLGGSRGWGELVLPRMCRQLFVSVFRTL
jgi:hypothetical protein